MYAATIIFWTSIVSVSADAGGAAANPELQRLPATTSSASTSSATTSSGSTSSGSVPPATADEQVVILEDVEEDLLPDVGEREWIWYQPSSWYRWEVWEGSFKLGINGGAGASDTMSLNTGAEVKRETRILEFDFDASYSRTTADSVTTQDIAIFDSTTDWKMGESSWSLFNKGNVTFDKLRAFDMRLVLNAGLGYKFVDTPASKLAARLGSGTSKEFGGPEERWVPEAVFGTDFEHRVGKRHKFKTTVDYFPDWEDYSAYRVTAKASWQIMLDQADKLSLKLEATDRYDSTPDGLQPNEINYALLLLWKL